MTTIVVDWNNVYSDSLSTWWYNLMNISEKIRKYEIDWEVYIVWYAWYVFSPNKRQFIQDIWWVPSTHEKESEIRKKIIEYMKDFPDNEIWFTILMISKKNRYLIKYSKNSWVYFETINEKISIWSGSYFAMWALHAGCDWLKALESAIKLDNDSWLPIQHLSLD